MTTAARLEVLWGLVFATGLYLIDRIAMDDMKLLAAILWTMLAAYALFLMPIVRGKYFRLSIFILLVIQLVLLVIMAALSLFAGQRLSLLGPWLALITIGLVLGIWAQTLMLLGVIHTREDHDAAVERLRAGATDPVTKRLAASRPRTRGARKRRRAK